MMKSCRLLLGRLARTLLAVLFFSLVVQCQSGPEPSGRELEILSPAGKPLVGVVVEIRSVHGTLVLAAVTDTAGLVRLIDIPPGTYQLTLLQRGENQSRLPAQRLVLEIGEATPRRIRPGGIVLRDEVTVTARRGEVDAIDSSPRLVAVRDRRDLDSNPLPTVGHALEGAPGVLLQQSTFGQVSPFLRGLTGYQVLNLVDGIRFNNSTFRSGPNQYLAFIEPSQVQRLEVMLGPASSQYGSDGLGGAIHLLTEAPRFRNRRDAKLNGEVRVSGATADLSTGLAGTLTGGVGRLAWLAGVDARRHQDLRPGGGSDSRHIFRRFLDLPAPLTSNLVGTRMQDTGFGSVGGHGKVALRLPAEQFLTFRYQRTSLDDIRSYKDLQGGLGRRQSAFTPQRLDLFYARYEKLGLWLFDSMSGSFSLNSQRDGSIRQGLRAVDRVITDLNDVDSWGYVGQTATHLGRWNALVFGAEVYDERIDARRDEADPVTGLVVRKRALYPNGSRYVTSGLFVHDTWDLIRRPERSVLRSSLGVRHTRVGFNTYAARNLDDAGRGLGVVDSRLTFADLTWHANLTWQLTRRLALHGLAARGFRAPNLNDLGALGLNDLGYEVPAESAVGGSGLVGTSDGEGVGSSGRAVAPLRPERIINYESGVVWRGERLTWRGQVFHATLADPIVRRTLLFPLDRVPTSLAGVAVLPLAQTALQRAQNVVGVATSLDPRAVKSFLNEGRVVYYGLESSLRYAFNARAAIDGHYSYLVGRELNPNRYVRRLPPQSGGLSFHFQPTARSWFQVEGQFSGRQERLSGGDLTDERIGAARRRRDIVDLLQGALVDHFMQPGVDERRGTLDDIFRPTGETIAAIRDRVLPIGRTINGVTVVDDTTRVPLYSATSGFTVLNFKGEYQLRDNVTIHFALRNILDRNYRFHGSGIDEPGINGFVGIRVAF